MTDPKPKRVRKRRAKPCPYCGSGDTLPIVYGLIDHFDPRFVPGGCIIHEGQPLRHCNDCGRGFDFRDWGGLDTDGPE
jgi:hypothetical protein